MTVYVEVVAGKKAGPNLTMLHGWGLNSAVWNGVREVLAAQFTLHLIDLPGHGRSAGAPVSNLPAMVEAVAEAMPARSHLLGWSLGGHVAMALTHAYPDRIERLITVGSTPCYVAAPDWPYGKKAEVLEDFSRRLATNYPATIRNFLGLQVLGPPQQMSGVREMIRALQELVSAQGAPSMEGLTASLEILRGSDIRARIPEIRTPTLVIQGDHDALTPEPAARWLSENLPGARYCLLEHAAHAPFLSHREAFLAQVQAFLSIPL